MESDADLSLGRLMESIGGPVTLVTLLGLAATVWLALRLRSAVPEVRDRARWRLGALAVALVLFGVVAGLLVVAVSERHLMRYASAGETGPQFNSIASAAFCMRVILAALRMVPPICVALLATLVLLFAGPPAAKTSA